MFASFNRSLLRHISRRIISKSTNRVLNFRRHYFSFSLIDTKFPNLNSLPCNYSTTELQVEEPVKLDKTQFRRTISDYYRSVIENNQDYHEYVFCLEKVKNETKNSENKVLLASRELLKDFEDNISSISKERLVTLKSLLHEEGKLTLYELAEVIHNIATCLLEDNEKGKNFQEQLLEIVKLLDKEGCDQFSFFTPEQKIFLADLWCKYHKSAFSLHDTRFIYKVMWKLFDHFSRLSRTQMIMFFHFASILRNAPRDTNDFRSYVEVQKLLPFFTIEEIGLICYSFRMIDRYPILEDGVNSIVDKLSQELFSCSSQSLKFISKMLSRTLPMKNTSMYSIQKTIANNSDKYSVNELLDFLCITVFKLSNADDSLLEIALKQAKKNIQEVSFKDLFRLLDLLKVLNVQDEELFQLTVEKLKTEKYFRSPYYIGALKTLIIFNVYPEDILSEILNENFYEELKGLHRNSIKEDVSFMEMSMTIERPHAKFSRLPEKKRRRLLQVTRFKQGDMKSYKIGSGSYVLEESLNRIYGTNKCYVFTSVVPHIYSNTTILKLDKNLKGQEIPESWRGGMIFNEILRPLDQDHYWVVLYLAKRIFYTKDGNLNAIGACMKRQLESLGFIPIPIYAADFVFLESEQEKDQFVENRIKEAIQKIAENK